MYYKRYYIWHNSLRSGKPWMIQEGYAIVHEASSLSQAKRWVTIQDKKEG